VIGAPAGGAHCAAARWTLPALLLAQLALVSWTFPAGELCAETPLLHIDGAVHWYRVQTAVNLAQQGRLTGYDPYFAAGSPAGVAQNVPAKPAALIAVLGAPWISAVVA
jgi:hypothetical protein